ncbi:MAG: GNAT family N-acetyltransferase [Clostridia bacterium]
MQTYPLADGRTLVLRTPAVTDAENCIAFLCAAGGETDYLLCDENGIPGLTPEGERTYLSDTLNDPRIGMTLGFVDGKLVTVFDIRPRLRQRQAHTAIVSLVVRKPYWHLGIGSAAMRTMVDFARSSGMFKHLHLDVRADNARAIALYKRFGFVQCGRLKDAICVHGLYYDQLLMDLEL